MSNIFGDGTESSGTGATSYDLLQNNTFNAAINDLNNAIASSTVNLNPILFRLNQIDSDQVAQNYDISLKLNTSSYNTDKTELTSWRDGVDTTLTTFFNEFTSLESGQTTQNNRLTALESNIASGYVTNSQLYAYQTTQQIVNDSQDSKIDDLYNRLGGTGPTVDLGPLTTRVTALEFSDGVQNTNIASKASLAAFNTLSTAVDGKVNSDTYSADIVNINNSLSGINSSINTINLSLSAKVNVAAYNNDKTGQNLLDTSQNNRLTALETSIQGNKVLLSQPTYNNVQNFVNLQDTFNTDIQNGVDLNSARISLLEGSITNPTITISNVTGLQTNLTNLQTNINTVQTNLSNHIIASSAHTAASISNAPITGLTQTSFNVQNALASLSGRIDVINLNSTGFSAYGQTALVNFYTSASSNSLPNTLLGSNYQGNSEIQQITTTSRANLLWNINQSLTRSADVGFKSLRLGSKFVVNSSAADNADTNVTTWDFAISRGDSASANYLRINPWRFALNSFYNANNHFSIIGPQFLGDTSSKMIVENNMILTNVSGTFSKSFSSIVSDLSANTTLANNLNTNVSILTVTVNNLTSTVSNNTEGLNTLNGIVGNLQSNMVTSNSVASFITSISSNQSGVAANLTEYNSGNWTYLDSVGRLVSKGVTMIDGSKNIYGHRLLGGINNNNEDSFRLFDFNGNLVFNANNTNIFAGGQLFFDSNRNINSNSIKTTSLLVGNDEIIDGNGAIHLHNFIISGNGSRVIVDTVGSIDSPQVFIKNEFAPNGFGLSIDGSNPSYIKFDGTAKIGDVTINNGIKLKNDLIVTDATNTIYPIRRNCVVEGIGGQFDNTDTLLGFNNTAKGAFTSSLGGNKSRVIVGYQNRINAPLSVICGSGNAMDDSGETNHVYIIGNNWSDTDLRITSGLKNNSNYICLGNASNDNNVAGSGTFLMIAGGSRIPQGSFSSSVSFVSASNGWDTVVPGINRPGSDIYCMIKSVSARKYKENIKNIPDKSFKIEELNPVRYNVKSTGREEIGFVADDLVGTSWNDFVVYEKNDVEGIAYNMMVVGLVDVIKQLQKRIEALEKK